MGNLLLAVCGTRARDVRPAITQGGAPIARQPLAERWSPRRAAASNPSRFECPSSAGHILHQSAELSAPVSSEAASPTTPHAGITSVLINFILWGLSISTKRGVILRTQT
jgi:hypothetical protein